MVKVILIYERISAQKVYIPGFKVGKYSSKIPFSSLVEAFYPSVESDWSKPGNFIFFTEVH